MATPYRQIRALYDDDTITVYQAYGNAIATAAVENQKLNASPSFRTGSRMTWIKPSWAWMLYRAGYSYKDAGQARILALRMKHSDFIGLLEKGVLTTHPPHQQEQEQHTSENKKTKEREKSSDVKIQWDPERTVRLDKLEYRSIQIGIPGALTEDWVENLIVGIEDVTERARDLKKVIDERPEVTDQELVELGLVPSERPFEIPEELQRALGMIWLGEGQKSRVDSDRVCAWVSHSSRMLQAYGTLDY
ncbi:hypothetical protein B0T19DRAFT_402019 [Cercophora scortea]|uniref:ATP-dependent RNA helicase DHX8 n=1 Tax=Cercophora scortea TaxID=314031 RepID=A0AAE0M9C7_9PEZI|nr:hypothetical protein B0T19DRAFT_402019 [Cercophora scortea]